MIPFDKTDLGRYSRFLDNHPIHIVHFSWRDRDRKYDIGISIHRSKNTESRMAMVAMLNPQRTMEWQWDDFVLTAEDQGNSQLARMAVGSAFNPYPL